MLVQLAGELFNGLSGDQMHRVSTFVVLSDISIHGQQLLILLVFLIQFLDQVVILISLRLQLLFKVR